MTVSDTKGRERSDEDCDELDDDDDDDTWHKSQNNQHEEGGLAVETVVACVCDCTCVCGGWLV